MFLQWPVLVIKKSMNVFFYFLNVEIIAKNSILVTTPRTLLATGRGRCLSQMPGDHPSRDSLSGSETGPFHDSYFFSQLFARASRLVVGSGCRFSSNVAGVTFLFVSKSGAQSKHDGPGGHDRAIASL